MPKSESNDLDMPISVNKMEEFYVLNQNLDDNESEIHY